MNARSQVLFDLLFVEFLKATSACFDIVISYRLNRKKSFIIFCFFYDFSWISVLDRLSELLNFKHRYIYTNFTKVTFLFLGCIFRFQLAIRKMYSQLKCYSVLSASTPEQKSVGKPLDFNSLRHTFQAKKYMIVNWTLSFSLLLKNRPWLVEVILLM